MPPAGGSLAESELGELLEQYGNVLDRAEKLPPVIWLRTRPPGVSWVARWWRLPHVTFGVQLLVLFHIGRSVDGLGRAYARRAALHQLDARGEREREMVTNFRASLRPVNWKLVLLVVSLLALLMGKAVILAADDLLGDLAFGVNHELDDDQMRQISKVFDSLTASATSLSGNSFTEVLEGMGSAGFAGVVLLVIAVLTVAYVLARPVSTVFRVKRIMFNLADEDAGLLHQTTSTWHTCRSVGLYAQERVVLERLGQFRDAREIPLDLTVSLVVVILIGGNLMVYELFQDPVPGSAPYAFAVLLLMIARIAWLTNAWRGRIAGGPELRRAAAGVLLAADRRIVDVRRPAEGFALGLLPFVSAFPLVRLSRQWSAVKEERDLQLLNGRSVSRWRRSLATIGMLVCSAYPFYAFASPLLTLGRVWQARRFYSHPLANTAASLSC